MAFPGKRPIKEPSPPFAKPESQKKKESTVGRTSVPKVSKNIGTSFIPAKTIEEATKYAETTFIANGGIVEYGNLGIETINRINKVLTSMNRALGIKLDFIGTNTTLDKIINKKVTDEKARAKLIDYYSKELVYHDEKDYVAKTGSESTWAMQVNKGIFFHETPWKNNAKKLQRDLEVAFEMNFHKYLTPEAVVVHEIAHFLLDSKTISTTMGDSFLGVLTNHVVKNFKKTGRSVEDIIGYYGASIDDKQTRLQEEFAELVACLYEDRSKLKGKAPDIIPDEIEPELLSKLKMKNKLKKAVKKMRSV